MKKSKSLKWYLVLLLSLIFCVVIVLQIINGEFVLKEVIASKTRQIFEEVNYQYTRQLNDRISMSKKIADGIISNEKIKLLLAKQNREGFNYNTTVSQITMEVMKQLNTVSVNYNVVKGVTVHLMDGRTITGYCGYNYEPMHIDQGLGKDLKAEYFDYYWSFSDEDEGLCMLKYVADGSRVVGLLEIEFIDNLFGEILSTTASGLDMIVSIQDAAGLILCSNQWQSGMITQTKDDIVSLIPLNNRKWMLKSILPGDYLRTEFNRAMYMNIWIFAAASLPLFIIIFMIYYSVLNPLQQITNGLRYMQMRQWDFRLPQMTWSEFNLVSASFNEMADKLQEYHEQIKNQEKHFRELEMLSLASKFSPHFIYNTLDMIKWELELANRPEISELIVRFSQLLRYSISAETSAVPVWRDFRFIESYLLINRILSAKKLSFEINSTEDANHCFIPKLLIQPLIENSLKHGFANMSVEGNINIRASIAENILLIVVSDNGCGIDASMIDRLNRLLDQWNDGQKEAMREIGLGLYLVNSLIKHHYGPAYGIQLSTNDDGGLDVSVSLSHFPSIRLLMD